MKKYLALCFACECCCLAVQAADGLQAKLLNPRRKAAGRQQKQHTMNKMLSL